MLQFLWIICPVAVADCIRTPAFHKFKCFRHYIHICRYCDPSCRMFFQCYSPPLLIYRLAQRRRASPVKNHMLFPYPLTPPPVTPEIIFSDKKI